MTCKSAIHRDCDVLTTVEERLTKKKATDSRVHKRIAKLINEFMFDARKRDEAKIKEEAHKILRPERRESFVVTKVDELIWNHLHLTTRCFDARVQTARGVVVKGVIEITKMLDGILD